MGVFSRLNNYIRQTQLWRSIFRFGRPRDRQTRALIILNNLFLHFHPVSIRRSALKPWFTWGMGWITFYLFIVEVITGVLLMFYYRPVAEFAYKDMQALRAHVSFGLIREMHRWAGHAMVITIWLHMLRVFLTGSYKPPREFNWVTGVFLLVLTLMLAFTGYLLPWDQLSMWAVTVGTNMAGAAPLLGHEGPGASLLSFGDVPMVHQGSDVRFSLLGGSTVGPAALLRFYVLHCIALPILATIIIAVHFWRIRKDGGISGPP
ncbi:MAG: cytochrome b N-terminal domain-containing protein [Planctomycetota bacterium]|nr:MAG: cytochrome b N-terminal domain-containing protein [Planctomycetota bacterium]